MWQRWDYGSCGLSSGRKAEVSLSDQRSKRVMAWFATPKIGRHKARPPAVMNVSRPASGFPLGLVRFIYAASLYTALYLFSKTAPVNTEVMTARS
jgi:hypothetical protein